MKLRPLVDGAPNFRQVPGLPVYGVAIPTVQGLRRVLDLLGAAKGRRRVLWHSMREEPVLYVNGAPFVVREADKPFANLEYTGIDRERVEAMEARLKLDVLQESARYGAQILVAEEDDQFQVVQAWQPVSEADVQTPAEVYRELIGGWGGWGKLESIHCSVGVRGEDYVGGMRGSQGVWRCDATTHGAQGDARRGAWSADSVRMRRGARRTCTGQYLQRHVIASAPNRGRVRHRLPEGPRNG